MSDNKWFIPETHEDFKKLPTNDNPSTSVYLKTDVVTHSRRLRAFKKAQKSVVSSYDETYLDLFWELLINNLKQRHAARPKHSLGVIRFLISKFPNEIVPLFGLNNGKCLTDVVVYKSTNVHHAHYVSACPGGRNVADLDLIFLKLLSTSLSENADYFDSEISILNNCRDLSAGLYSFKYEFGGGGICHRFFTKEL